ncbi:Vacuolar membrane protease [Clarias magur]|uniref:Vacuolar membrane protease n=1 Tax=Clarias magur TaxID=1594786 RepID=A0A8J4WV82_CLAMG|nr:Vacuolar membrane protease [Clarias magur]
MSAKLCLQTDKSLKPQTNPLPQPHPVPSTSLDGQIPRWREDLRFFLGSITSGRMQSLVRESVEAWSSRQSSLSKILSFSS